MSADEFALLISAFALMVSIAVPLVQWRFEKRRIIASKRSLLLQTILASKSTLFISMHELIELLRRYKTRMDSEQRTKLEAMVPRMRQQHDELQKLHDDWSNFDDGESLPNIEQTTAYLTAAASDAIDTAKLIENGRKSYEEA